MSYEIGDKFVIEIGNVIVTDNVTNEKLYQIKGFNTLVFNEYELAKLEQQRTKSYVIEVGDEVTFFENKMIVLETDGVSITGITSDGTVKISYQPDLWAKTGRNFVEEIDDFIKRLK